MLKNFSGLGKIIVFFVFILTVFFSEAIVNDLSLTPAETIYHIDMMHGQMIDTVSDLRGNGLLFDLAYQMYPWRMFIETSFDQGFFPLWNPYSLTGLPFLANDQSSVFELTKLLSYALDINAQSFLLFSGFIILFLAGLFTYLYTRNLKISKIGSLIAGASFMFSGPLVVWLGYPLTAVIIWLPLMLFAIDKLSANGSKIWIVILALAVAWQFFAGNPEISLFILVLCFAYTVFRLMQTKQFKLPYKIVLKKILYILIALILGFGISAVQILPAWDFISQSEAIAVGRGGVGGIGVIGAVSEGDWLKWRTWDDFHYLTQTMILLVYPDYYGNPKDRAYWGPSNYNENALHIGVIALIFSLLALFYLFSKNKRRTLVIFWLSVVVICLGTITEAPFFVLTGYLPVFKWVAIGRLRFLLVFALAVLAGLGYDWVSKKSADLKFRIGFFNIWFLLIAGWLRCRIIELNLDQTTRQTAKLFLIAIVLLVNIGLVMMFFHKKKIFKNWTFKKAGQVIVLAIIVFELQYYSILYHPVLPKDLVFPKTQAIEFLQENIDNFRLTSFREQLTDGQTALLPNSSVIWGLQDIRGYEIVKPIRYDAFERHLAGKDSRFEYKEFDQKIFDTLAVKYFVQGFDDLANQKLVEKSNLELAYQDQSINIYENLSVLPRAFVVFNIHPVVNYTQAQDVFLSPTFRPDMTALVETDNPDNFWAKYQNNHSKAYTSAHIAQYLPNTITIEIDIDQDGYLVLTDSYDPGWVSYIDGQKTKLYPTDVAFRGLFVPAGKHTVILNYEPKSFYIGIYISLIAVIICVGIILLWLKEKKDLN